MVEYMEFSHLIRIASEQTDPLNRMKYIAAFAVSALACNWDRMGKVISESSLIYIKK